MALKVRVPDGGSGELHGFFASRRIYNAKYESRTCLLGDKGNEGGGFAEINAERAFFADVGEGYFEGILSLIHLIGFHGGASDDLFFIVGGAGGYILVDNESPGFAGDGIDGVGADGDGRSAESKLNFGEEGHGSAAGSPGFAIGRFIALGCNGAVADVDLATVVESAGGGRGLGLLR